MLSQASIYYRKNPSARVTLDDVIEHSTELHATIVNKLLKDKGYRPEEIDVIGYHGQTLFHNPVHRITIQVGNGEGLANKTGICVVNDFRSRDVSKGGQGAPFAPLYHQALAVRDQRLPLAVVNCGGIANISLIIGNEPQDLLGYDTGPGNSLVDRFVKQRTEFNENMDLGGKYGETGHIHIATLGNLFQKSIIKNEENYFAILPPKSLDENDLDLVSELDNLWIEDGCTTLEAFTAESIVQSLHLIPEKFKTPKQWVLVGGGWYNPVILRELKERVKSSLGADVKVNLAEDEEIGWSNKAMEAQIFAYLAVRALQGRPISVPETTKVPIPLSGGHAYCPIQGVTENIKNLLEKNLDVLSGYQDK